MKQCHPPIESRYSTHHRTGAPWMRLRLAGTFILGSLCMAITGIIALASVPDAATGRGQLTTLVPDSTLTASSIISPAVTPTLTRTAGWYSQTSPLLPDRLQSTVAIGSGGGVLPEDLDLCGTVVSSGGSAPLWIVNSNKIVLDDPHISSGDPRHNTLWVQACHEDFSPIVRMWLTAPDGAQLTPGTYSDVLSGEFHEELRYHRFSDAAIPGVYLLTIADGTGIQSKEITVVRFLDEYAGLHFSLVNASTGLESTVFIPGEQIQIYYNATQRPHTIEVGLYRTEGGGQAYTLLDAWTFPTNDQGRYSEVLEIPADAPLAEYMLLAGLNDITTSGYNLLFAQSNLLHTGYLDEQGQPLYDYYRIFRLVASPPTAVSIGEMIAGQWSPNTAPLPYTFSGDAAMHLAIDLSAGQAALAEALRLRLFDRRGNEVWETLLSRIRSEPIGVDADRQAIFILPGDGPYTLLIDTYRTEEPITAFPFRMRMHVRSKTEVAALAEAYLARGHEQFENGDLEQAVRDFSDATILNRELVGAYNALCWTESLLQRPYIALSACQRAIAIEPHPAIFDSRGLAYALAGDMPAAIADFQRFVDWLERADDPQFSIQLAKRKSWIAALQRGENPFTPEVLAELRHE